MENVKNLAQLVPGEKGVITAVGAKSQTTGIASVSDEVLNRLLEMGLIEGSSVEMLHEAPFGGDPIAVRTRGTLIALRRNEAACILVRLGVKL